MGSFIGSAVEEQEENEEGTGEQGASTAPPASATTGHPALSHRIMAVRSSYYHPEEEEEEGEFAVEWGEEGVSYLSDASSHASSGVGALASGGGGAGATLTSGLPLPPRIVPAVRPPLTSVRAHSSGSGNGGGRGRGIAADKITETAAMVQEMGERMTRLEGKLDALIGLLPAAMAQQDRSTRAAGSGGPSQGALRGDGN